MTVHIDYVGITLWDGRGSVRLWVQSCYSFLIKVLGYTETTLKERGLKGTQQELRLFWSRFIICEFFSGTASRIPQFFCCFFCVGMCTFLFWTVLQYCILVGWRNHCDSGSALGCASTRSQVLIDTLKQFAQWGQTGILYALRRHPEGHRCCQLSVTLSTTSQALRCSSLR